MAEYIERKRAIVDACNALELYPSEYARLEDALNRVPAADVAPVVHGRWDIEWDAERDPKRFFVRIVCSNCGLKTGQKSNYCPNCGARMDKEDT